MKWIHPLIASLLSLGALSAQAGPSPESGSKEIAAEALVVPHSPESGLTFVMPGWMAGLDGTIGVKGLDTAVDVGFDEITKNLDMIGAGSLEGRYGKLGFILEGIYLKASFGGDTPGPLLSSVSVGVEQVLAEATLTYRFFENDRAWMEFLAGARYVYMGNELTLSVDSAGVRSASAELSASIIDRTADAARLEVQKRLPGLVARLESEIADLKAQAIADIEGRVQDKVEDIKEAIRDRIDAGIGSAVPAYGSAIAQSGPIRDVIRDYVNAKVTAEIEAARAQVSAAVAEARARARREAERRLAAAEKRLAKAIEKEITSRIPDSPLAASKAWVDPFVGFRGRCQLWEDWYLTARGDIGGFGVGSELTWNVFAALGLDLNERTSMELGYRHLQIDYQSGPVSLDAAMKGPYVGMRIEF
jgi:hypothetical protein